MSDWFSLDHLASLVLHGPDAAPFAHAQFTADLTATDPRRWHASAWCDPRGRTLAVVLVRQREQLVEVVAPTSQQEFLLDRLPVFAIGRQVDIRPGPAVCGSLDPAGDEYVLAFDATRAIRLEDGRGAAGTDRLSDWHRADLAMRFPWLGPATGGRFLPQSLGLEKLGGLSYAKGCFPGQEVIARVHYLGKVKHHTVALALDGPLPPAGAAVRNAGGDRLGELLWGVDDNGRSHALAVVDTGTGAGSSITVESESGGTGGQVSL